MKKLVILLLLITFYSCGPRRLGCGPGRRCEVPIQKENHQIIPQKNPEAKTSGLV
ncbi:hypothetical protein H9X57_08665 [Flavobacterium piscinae]|uniref:hypothetical protein n=1 Tax=Flavobacterium piscinae TaxID=2506424 RepID=UPI0013E9156E|nr:hypothetical protein [Flavobacterium piscinae]MBC8883443.1 hypothetical protein [Flavobacterium piscinae]